MTRQEIKKRGLKPLVTMIRDVLHIEDWVRIFNDKLKDDNRKIKIVKSKFYIADTEREILNNELLKYNYEIEFDEAWDPNSSFGRIRDAYIIRLHKISRFS